MYGRNNRKSDYFAIVVDKVLPRLNPFLKNQFILNLMNSLSKGSSEWKTQKIICEFIFL